MRVRQILNSKEILAVVPDTSEAPRRSRNGKSVRWRRPLSSVRTPMRPYTTIYLDKDSASLLSTALQNRRDESQTTS